MFPNTVVSPEIINGSIYLYFHDPILFPIPPAVVGVDDAFRLVDLAASRRPPWEGSLAAMFDAQMRLFDGWEEMQSLLSPISDPYPRRA